jgi:hypothetical protein
VGRPERQRPLERPRCRWENITKLYVGDTKVNITNWVDFIQDWYRRRGLVNVAHTVELRVTQILENQVPSDDEGNDPNANAKWIETVRWPNLLVS